ncbi:MULTISPECIES: type II toxin-antitoxin system RelE/ParE family toxin [unclassified Sphingomonas]|uniref:type II toxin-antitoxin system RelE/ParE family toxin n=1 Tax=unclassified Sphingomonas TaxID=196159 RepID=UPI000BD63FCE|nr:MAG: hypothetical protein B7Z43_02990 [Sphingomonas sp. 12-62-6]OYX39279.1 MAG: hypothetical protein B7Y98_04880 [Sphingomonas sp. 32-62-10]OYY66152.1 MAG: hypothetical protein B7Y49_03885 [Sphingomonas sp. 28-62-11]
MRAIRWSREARADLTEIDDCYRPLNADYARRIGRKAIAASGFLALHPGAGELLPDRLIRKWRVAGTPYLILYRVEGSNLRVVRLIHAARDWTNFV